MNLVDISFRTGIDLTRQRLPSGPEYLYLSSAAGVLKQARSEVLGWDNPELRKGATRLLQIFEDEVKGGQQTIVATRRRLLFNAAA